jgi:nucleotide-binding universal stress UspA family protein
MVLSVLNCLAEFKEATMFRNVLVGYDGSPQAQRALDEAIEIARSDRSTLTVMTVVPSVTPFAGVGTLAYGGAAVARVEADLQHDFERSLVEAVERVPDDIPVTRILARGRPGPQIVRQARTGNHDLVVVGSRGRGTARSLVLGSVSNFVVHHLRGAALVIHEDPVPA